MAASGGDLGFDQESPMAPFSSNDLRSIGRIKMTWEESVSLWTEQEGENHQGRVDLAGSSFLHADQLTYFDDSMVACAFESFSDGPLKGFSVDKFYAGQQLKVLGRRKSALIASAPSGPIERARLRPMVAPARSTPPWEVSDPTEYYMGYLRSPLSTLPSMADLPWHLQDPPPEEFRFPLQGDLYRNLPPGKELFTTTSNEFLDSKLFTLDILGPLIRTPTTLKPPTSRDSFITLWDDCINRIITRFCPIPLTLIRKSSPKSEQNLLDQWPNVTGFIKGMCLWRGEETHKLREGVQTNPSASIAEKLFWCYADLPYILGYHAVGPVVTFCALCRSPHDVSNKIVRTDLLSLDLSTPAGRIKALVPCWRIACLLPPLADHLLTVSPRYSDFAFRVDHGTGHVAAEMTPCTVTRFYSSMEEWSAAKEMYDVLGQQVPYMERVSQWSEPDLWISFMPRGFKAKPTTVEELVEALKHVTKVLVALHDLGFMHRDLSWDNVLRRCGREDEWVVCGFEDTVVAPQINSSFGFACGSSSISSGEGKNAPEMGRGVHGVKVDVWGIGFLLRTSEIGGAELPSQLKELETRCLDQNPETRPTAADCYHQLLQFQAARERGDCRGQLPN